MLKSGLVSITFRKLSVSKIINAARKASLETIEWGGDVHVPHGNFDIARQVYNMTVDSGLKVAAYGSYFRAGEQQNPSINDVVKTAVLLKAPLIRIWAGRRGSSNIDMDYQKKIISDSQKIADAAYSEGIDIAFEFHVSTLCDNSNSAIALIKSIRRSNIKSYWQPVAGIPREKNINFLEAVLPWLSNIHVFNWIDFEHRLLLQDAVDIWTEYLKLARTGKYAKYAKYAMIEHVMNDSLENFYKDAQTLNEILANNG